MVSSAVLCSRSLASVRRADFAFSPSALLLSGTAPPSLCSRLYNSYPSARFYLNSHRGNPRRGLQLGHGG